MIPNKVSIAIFQYTFSELSDKVQASDQELLLTLQKLNACMIEGKKRFEMYVIIQNFYVE